MKIKTLALILTTAALTSCKTVDTFLVKHAGVTSTDMIKLGIKNKSKVDDFLNQYRAAKEANLTSAKSVTQVTPSK